MKKKTIKAWAVICSEQGFLTAHWHSSGAIRQMKEIKIGSHEAGLTCSHKVVPCIITL